MTGSFRAEERSFRVCRGGEGRPVAVVGNGATVRGQLNGEGEAVAELTAVAATVEVGSGTH